MTRERIGVTFSPQEYERIEERAENNNLSNAEYVRQRFRAGELLWNSEQLDPDVLEEISGAGGDENPVESLPAQQTGPVADTQNRNKQSSVASPREDLTAILLRNIPHINSGDAVTDEELMETIFGTERERQEALEGAIKELFGDKITRRHDGGLVMTGDEDE